MLAATVLALGLLPQLSRALPMPGDGPARDAGVDDNTGANRLVVSIPVPPGTAGFVPALTLRYSSDNGAGDGPFGMGWKLELGEIRRSFRFGIPTFDDGQDAFELGGELLVVNPSESRGGATRYHTMTESFSRILHFSGSGDDRWEVTRPDGTILRFGADGSSRVLRDGTGGPIARWLLREMQDSHGNTIRFEHLIEDGADYPLRVQYTFRDGAPVGRLHQIEFRYADRPDPSLTFTSGVRREIRRRASEIVVTSGSDVYRRIVLTYADEELEGKQYATGRSRLASIQVFGVGGDTALPPQRFEYRDPADDLAASSGSRAFARGGVTLPSGVSFDFPVVPFFDLDHDGRAPELPPVRFADVDGDGRVDLVQAIENKDGKVTQQVFLGDPDGFVRSDAWSRALALDPEYLASSGLALRLGPDSEQYAPAPNPVLFTSELAGEIASRVSENPRAAPVDPSLGADPFELTFPATWQLADVNGDGRADLLSAYGFAEVQGADGRVRTPARRVGEVWINTGEGWERDPVRSAALPEFATGQRDASAPQEYHQVAFLELDGDGLADLALERRVPEPRPRMRAFHFFRQDRSAGWQEAPEYGAVPVVSGSATVPTTEPLFADFNRDGLTDVIAPSLQGRATLNTGRGWCDATTAEPIDCPSATRFRLPVPLNNPIQLADLTGDGLDDLVLRAADPNQPGRAWIQDPAAPNGSVFVEDPRFAPPPGDSGFLRATGGPRKQPGILDADADGTIDVLARNRDLSFRGTVRFTDRLSHLENGQGAQIAYTYESAARVNPALLALADTFAGPSEATPRGSTEPVLATRSVTGVDLEPFTEGFAYAGRRFFTDLRMSAGFALVQRTLASASTRNLFFAQQLGLSGQLLRGETLDPKTGALVAQEDRRFEVLPGDDPGVGPGSTRSARVGRLVERSSSALYGPARSERPGAVFREQLEYGPGSGRSGFGFVTRRTAVRPSGTLVTTRIPAPPDLDRWIVQLPGDVRVQDGAGRDLARTTMEYSDEGDPIAVTAFEGPRGSLESATPRTTRREFDGFGNLRAETDSGNRRTELCYDGDASFPSGAACSSSTNEATHTAVTATLDPLDQVTAQLPDSITGDPLEVHRIYSGERDKQRFDPFGRVVETSFQPASGRPILLGEVRYTDAAQSPTGQAFAESLARTTAGGTEVVRQATYLDGLGRPVRQVSESAPRDGTKRFFGTTTRISPEARELITTFPAACGGDGADANCADLLGGDQPRTVEQRDALGRPISITTPDGVTRFAYRSVTRAHPDTGDASFDAVLALDPRGALTQRIFDQGRLVFVEECRNALAPRADPARLECTDPAVTFYRYEASGELADLFTPQGGASGSGTPALRTVFDSLGRPLQSFDANKDGPTAIEYDAAGEIRFQTNARGMRVEFQRDPLGRPTDVRVPIESGERTYHLIYDSRTRKPSRIEQKQIAPIAGLLSVQEFGYDALGRTNRQTLRVEAGPPLITDLELDLLGRTTLLRLPDRSTTLGYRYEGGFLRQLCELGSSARCSESPTFMYLSGVEYDAIGRETGLVGPTAASAPAPRFELTYDPDTYRLEHLELIPSAGRGVERLDLTYKYDPSGNLLSAMDGSPASGPNDLSQAVSYQYDARNRLRERTRARNTVQFTYDDLGNLRGKAVSMPGGQNQTFDPDHPNRVIEAAGIAYSYDADGNVTSRGAQRLRFDALGRMECIGVGTGCGDFFFYGFDGARLAAVGASGPSRVFAGDVFELEPGTGAATVRVFALGREIAFKRIARADLRSTADAWLVPLERSAPWALGTLAVLGLGWLLALALRGGLSSGLRLRPAAAGLAGALATLLVAPPGLWAAPLPTDRGTYRRFVWEDRLGSAVHVTDETGTVVAQRAFEPFGEVAGERASEPTEQTFAGQRLEDASGLYFFQARWYDPAAGRFLSIDPLVRSIAAPQSINGYSYVENDPTNRIDPTGLEGEAVGGEEIVVIGPAPDPDPFAMDPFFDPGSLLPSVPDPLAGLNLDADPGAAFSATASPEEIVVTGRRPQESSLTTDLLIVGGLTALTVGLFFIPFDGPAGEILAGSALSARLALLSARLGTGFGLLAARVSAFFGAAAGATTTVFRVEGAGNQRLLINAAGEVTVRGTNALFLNFGSLARAEAFLAKRLEQGFGDTVIKSFQVPTSFLEQLSRSAVPEALARQAPNLPFTVDVAQAVNQFGLRAPQIEALGRAIIQGTGRQ